jgi:hypothetical protein
MFMSKRAYLTSTEDSEMDEVHEEDADVVDSAPDGETDAPAGADAVADLPAVGVETAPVDFLPVVVSGDTSGWGCYAQRLLGGDDAAGFTAVDVVKAMGSADGTVTKEIWAQILPPLDASSSDAMSIVVLRHLLGLVGGGEWNDDVRSALTARGLDPDSVDTASWTVLIFGK